MDYFATVPLHNALYRAWPQLLARAGSSVNVLDLHRRLVVVMATMCGESLVLPYGSGFNNRGTLKIINTGLKRGFFSHTTWGERLGKGVSHTWCQ
ncbi:hypothetical protein JTE90_019493 [Oedothorax gibbosus]|uniref:Uncharacterized protein n=1 Tax=Oedothorax gibbosus TaxID=931172 RepID=A0AAV6UJF3_9ARAC|nr:hypothetical protein JTE90_019493 [Oedothorax gibbosus]